MDSKATSSPRPDAAELSARVCVFTALLGGYEILNEQPMAAQSNIPFICLTDDPDLRSDTWQMRVVSPAFAMDPARSQRDFKLRPHLHLPEFDLSLYIDNSVFLIEPPERILERYPLASGFCLARHSIHDSLLVEFLEVARRGLDDQSRIFEQLNHYALACPEILEEHHYWGGILLRDHGVPRVRAMSEIWYANVLRYSRRDQLSANLAFRQAGLTPDVMDIDNYSSWFHAWPFAGGRPRSRGELGSVVPYGPPVARIRELELQLAESEQRSSEAAQGNPRRGGRMRRVARMLVRKK